MKLEVGKTYITAGGVEVTMHHKDECGDFSSDTSGQVWLPDGKVWEEYGDESEDYIVGLVKTHPDPDRYIRILEAMLTGEQVKTANRIMEVTK